MNVLIFPAGTELGREIYLSLQYCKDVTLYLAGSDYENQAMYYTQPYHILPSVTDNNWLTELNDWLTEYNIDYIFPAHDEALVALVQERENLAAGVVACGREACEITRSKSETYKVLKDIIPVPEVYEDIEVITAWPVFLKPDRGQGANGTRIVHSLSELRSGLSVKQYGKLIISEFLPGEEYTVDCFTARNKGVLFCQARTRERIRNGIAMASQNVELEEVKHYASAISARLNLYGAWFFQLKRNTFGELVLLEVAPRIAGTMALNRSCGVNFPLLTLYEHRGKPVKIMPVISSARLSRSIINKYRCDIEYQHVYIDFDDTVIVNGGICPPVINFLYQCLNKNKKIYLITRHQGNLQQALEYFRIAQVFDDVIHIVDASLKSKYIKHESAIFIDDSFSERLDVSHTCGLMTFDNSMIELLLD